MIRSTNRVMATGLAVAAVSVFTTAASASIPQVVLEIVATNDTGTATFQVTSDMGSYDPQSGIFTWQSGANANIELTTQGGELVATLNSGLARYVDDPVVAISFALTAGSSDTVFSVSSGLLGYAGIMNADGFASAANGITDNNGDGATLTAAGSLFTASTNNGVFAGLLGNLSVADFDSTSQNAASSAPGTYTTIPGLSTDSFVSFDFTLSAYDTATGNGVFVVQVPAPATLALCGVGFAALRRRR